MVRAICAACGSQIKQAADDNAAQLQLLLQAIVVVFNVPARHVTGRPQKRQFARARHAFVKYAVEEFGCSYAAIGRFLGRDHTTMIAGHRAADNLIPRAHNQFAEHYRQLDAIMRWSNETN